MSNATAVSAREWKYTAVSYMSISECLATNKQTQADTTGGANRKHLGAVAKDVVVTLTESQYSMMAQYNSKTCEKDGEIERSLFAQRQT